MRDTLSDLVAQLRLMINDPAGDAATFSDDAIADVLDNNSTISDYVSLLPKPEISNGVTQYKKFEARHRNWESDAQLVNGSYEGITAETCDYKRGLFTFAESQPLPVMIHGVYFDLNGAAAELWGMKASIWADQFDQSVDGGNFSLSQKYDHAVSKQKEFSRLSVKGAGMTLLRRVDVADA